MSLRAAISPIGTGAVPRRATSAKARTALADFVVITSNRRASLVCVHDGPEEDGPLGAPNRADGGHFLLLSPAEPELRAGLDRPRRAQVHPCERVRAPVLPV